MRAVGRFTEHVRRLVLICEADPFQGLAIASVPGAAFLLLHLKCSLVRMAAHPEAPIGRLLPQGGIWLTDLIKPVLVMHASVKMQRGWVVLVYRTVLPMPRGASRGACESLHPVRHTLRS